MSDTLFDVESIPQSEPGPTVPKGQRQKQRQVECLSNGLHPLTAALGWPLRLHAEAAPADDPAAPGRRCGNCWYRISIAWHDRKYPKCSFGWDDEIHVASRASHGSGTDARAWWPGCRDHVYGDPSLSPDAARYVPATEGGAA